MIFWGGRGEEDLEGEEGGCKTSEGGDGDDGLKLRKNSRSQVFFLYFTLFIYRNILPPPLS